MLHPAPVRMGMMPQPYYPSPYLATAHYSGVRWAYKKSKRQSCAGYDQAVRDWEKAKSNFKGAGCKMTSFFGLRRGKCYDLGNKMKAIEQRGKAAWKTCKAGLPDEVVAEAEAELVIDPVTGMPVGEFSYDDSGDDSGDGMGMVYGIAGIMVLASVGFVVWKRSKKA